MVFASTIFLYYFLPLFLALYFLTPARGKNLLIALASYVFYGWWRPDFVTLMLISTVVDFSCGKGILRDRRNGKKGKAWLWLSLIVNLALAVKPSFAGDLQIEVDSPDGGPPIQAKWSGLKGNALVVASLTSLQNRRIGSIRISGSGPAPQKLLRRAVIRLGRIPPAQRRRLESRTSDLEPVPW